MGTVGLSFGSPTSGAGFDVSSTVAEIVGNLQNVETPWKNQLTSLQSQDTAISSLGTLFSNLSNDVSNLTDFQGVLAEKEGSSSDQNVLTLTAATPSAIAGTHAVTVSNLAQTSSGYLTAITNVNDTLSGSITIKAGSGTAQTITLNSSNNTLAGLASAINASGAGVTASVLTDSSGSRLSLVSSTSGAAGEIAISGNSIVDTSNSGAALTYTDAVDGKDANLTVDGVSLTSSSNTVANLIPGVTFQLLAPSATESDGSLEPVQVVIANDNAGVESTVSAMVSDYNAAVSAINAQEGNTSSGTPEPLFGSPTLSLLQQQLLGTLNASNPNGSLTSIAANANTTLSGSISIQVGSKSAQTVTLDSSDNTLAGMASAINHANLGATAAVTTLDGESTLSLTSQTAGSAGALTISSSVVASTPAAVAYSDTGGYTSSTADSGTMGPVTNASDTLSGSVSIQVGSGAAQTITLDSSDNTLAGLAEAINTADIGVNASVNATAVGSNAIGTLLTLTSATVGEAGAMSVVSNIEDQTNATTTPMDYTNSSDINSLTSLGISVNNDGSLTFDATSLDSVLNTDYNSVVGFFQNSNSWGQKFSTMLTNAGSSSATGVLSLASSSNSSIESTLNADISKEESLISAQQTSLTAELNSANEIMQQLPTQLEGVNELYSAITGYNQNING
jgi:flagellar hook-associated protein 2